MENALTPRRPATPEERASEIDLRLEHLATTLQQMRQTNASLGDLEERLTAMTAECGAILEKWAKNDERHASAVLELHARLAEWNDIERRLLHESTTRLHQFELSVQHEWEALRERQEAPLARLDAHASRVAEACLAAVAEAIDRFKGAEARLGTIEEELRRDMAALSREVREALADLRHGAPLPGKREPWSLDNVVRLHNELRAESGDTAAALSPAPGVAPVTAAAVATRRALPQRIADPGDGSESAAGTGTTPDPRPAWRRPAVVVAVLLVAAAGAYGTYLYSRVQAGVRDAVARAAAAERGAEATRVAASQELATVTRAADSRVASAAEVARDARHLAMILAAADLQRFDLVDPASGRRAAQVLWSRSQGVSLSTTRLDPPPAGRAYQLWLLTPNAATSIGTVPVPADGRTLVTFPPPERLPRPIVAARVTMEAASGSTKPTGNVLLRTPPPAEATTPAP